METTTRPLFALYVVWHPSNVNGGKLAELLRRHCSRDRHRNIAGEPGLSVIYRSATAPRELVPLSIDWDEAATTAVVVLVDSQLTRDQDWSKYVRELSRNAKIRGLSARLFPVLIEPAGRELQLEEQALRWDRWEESSVVREHRLVRDLTCEFIRMLRHRLRGPETSLTDYLENIQVFISHSKHDDAGESVARSMRDWLHNHSALSSFFDVHDIPAGLSSREVLLHQIGTSALVALHTDSYSSREWCRREVIEAKRRHVPMIVVDCLNDIDQRSFPYMGNVPIVRMGADQQDRIRMVIGCLLDEVFRTYLVSARKPLYRSFPVTIHHTFRASCSPISSRKMPAIGLGGVIGGGPAPIFGTRP